MDPNGPVLPTTAATTPARPLPLQQQPQQRPSLTYFLFLSLLFYLINSSNPPSLAHLAQNNDDARTVYHRKQAALLAREARAEGLARWLGTSETDGPYLNSTLYPDIANGTAPVFADVNGTSTQLNEAFPIPVFHPSNRSELAPVVPLVQRLFASTAPGDSPPVYPQNLTGFGKGSWEVLPFSWEEMGLNETWTEERIVEVREPEEGQNGTAVGAGEGEGLEPSSTGDEGTPGETSEAPATKEETLQRRQAGEDGTSPALNDTLPPSNLTTITETFNRTLHRGAFPWLSRSPPHAHRVSFNLRSLQTQVVGPVVPLPEGLNELDDGEVLQFREAREEWEREGPVVYVGGTITFTNPEDEDDETELDLEAMQFLSTGRIYGYATPSFVQSQLYELISLPLSLHPSPSPSTLSDPLLNRTTTALAHASLLELRRRINNTFASLEDAGGLSGGATGGGETHDDAPIASTFPRCAFTFYGAVAPLPPPSSSSSARWTPALYAESYRALFRPSGSSVPALPGGSLSALLSSSTCGLVLSLPSIALTPTQTLWARGEHFALLLAAAQGAVVLLLVRQLERAQSRPGSAANVAPVSIAGMCMVDAYVFVSLLTVGIVTYTRVTPPLILCAFLGLLSSLLFGMRYVALIREATPDTPPPAPAVVRAPQPPAEGGDGATAGDAAASVVEGSSSGVSAREKLIFGSIIGTLVFAIYLIIWWGWTALLLGIVYSYWLPQIIHNVARGTARQSLAPEFVVGQTVARLVLPVYVWGVEGNCLQVETSPWIYLLILYSSSQALLLLLQQRLSSPVPSASPLSYLLRTPASRSAPTRFFLPRALVAALELEDLAPPWAYHPHDPPEALLADLRVSAAESGSQYAEPDCPICLTPVQVVPSKLDSAMPGKADEVRLACAITPCRHVVHTECLEQWVAVRSICPVCRAGLPPLR
ncbi:hypothetical protein JCM10207_000441 [Rhodosporidiobolus poonsookiae]